MHAIKHFEDNSSTLEVVLEKWIFEDEGITKLYWPRANLCKKYLKENRDYEPENWINSN